ASTASTWPRATTWGARSTRPRACCPRLLSRPGGRSEARRASAAPGRDPGADARLQVQRRGHRLFGRRSQRWQGAELAHHFGAVHVGVVVLDAAVADGEDVAALDVDGGAVGRQPFEVRVAGEAALGP